MQINPLDTPGVPFEIELLNPNPSSSRKGYRVSFQVSEEVHSAFMAAREGNLRLIGKLAVAPDNDDQPAHDAVNGTKPKREKKPKEPKGPFGFMWEYLHPHSKHGGAGFVSLPGVREAIETARFAETEDVWKILHRVFEAETLAKIGPDDVLAKFPDNPAVELAIRRAKKFQDDKEAKANG